MAKTKKSMREFAQEAHARNLEYAPNSMAEASVINPDHYKNVEIRGVRIEPADVIEAFAHGDEHLSQALKYLLRRGRKPGTTYLKDVGKGLWWVARAILAHGGELELPPDPRTGALLFVTRKLVNKGRARGRKG